MKKEEPQDRPIYVPNFKTSERQTMNQLSYIKNVRPFTSSVLNNPGGIRSEVFSECESMPAIDMKRYKNDFHSISLFVEKGVELTNDMIDQADQLAYLVAYLATHVFEISVNGMHLFRDINTSQYMYNDCCFFYYECYRSR